MVVGRTGLSAVHLLRNALTRAAGCPPFILFAQTSRAAVCRPDQSAQINSRAGPTKLKFESIFFRQKLFLLSQVDKKG